MKVYYNTANPSIVAGNTKTIYPAGSLNATVDGNTINIWPPDGSTPIFSGHYSLIETETGVTFSNVTLAVSYLNLEFAKLPYSDTNEFDPGDLAAYWNSL